MYNAGSMDGDFASSTGFCGTNAMLAPGDEPIPGYRLEKFLGRGQYGEVWRATSPGRASVALKFLNLYERQGLKEFRAIQRMKFIRHPHLAPITALWLLDEDGRVLDDDLVDQYSSPPPVPRETLVPETSGERKASPQRLVMATLLCDKNLLERLAECQQQGQPGMPVEELLRYMEEAAKGIDFLNSARHDLGEGPTAVQHCDIKPANIMLTGDSVMICDFGVARFLSEGRAAVTGTSMAGSPAYMAPECIRSKPSSTSDQYSLAVTYVELRTGRLPFRSHSHMDVLQAHCTGDLDLSALNAGEQEVIRKATSVEPSDRYGSSSDMVRDLRRSLDTSEPPPAPRRSLAALIAVLAVCVLGLSLLLVRLREQGRPDAPSDGAQDPAAQQLAQNTPSTRGGPHTVTDSAKDSATQQAAPGTSRASEKSHEPEANQVPIDTKADNSAESSADNRDSSTDNSTDTHADDNADSSPDTHVDNSTDSNAGNSTMDVRPETSDSAEDLKTLMAAVSEPGMPWAGLDTALRGALLARLEGTELSRPEDQQLVANTRQFVAGRLSLGLFARYLREELRVPPPLLVVPFAASEAQARIREWSDYLGQEATITNRTGIKLALIPPGRFPMGIEASDVERLVACFPDAEATYFDDELRAPHPVCIESPFRLGVHEVTVGQFRQFVEASGYKTEAESDKQGGYGWNDAKSQLEGPLAHFDWRASGYEQTDEHPVVNVSWNDAQAFCQWLSKTEGAEYRLPTEAEWEYACRAGTSTWFYCGDHPDELTRVGNVADATAKAGLVGYQGYPFLSSHDNCLFSARVGRFLANEFGIYDLHGNVSEWCQDWYGKDYYQAARPEHSPEGPVGGMERVHRGGSWSSGAQHCRSTYRGKAAPTSRNVFLGFRVACVVSRRPTN